MLIVCHTSQVDTCTTHLVFRLRHFCSVHPRFQSLHLSVCVLDLFVLTQRTPLFNACTPTSFYFLHLCLTLRTPPIYFAHLPDVIVLHPMFFSIVFGLAVVFISCTPTNYSCTPIFLFFTFTLLKYFCHFCFWFGVFVFVPGALVHPYVNVLMKIFIFPN